jgi:hypothetical protein
MAKRIVAQIHQDVAYDLGISKVKGIEVVAWELVLLKAPTLIPAVEQLYSNIINEEGKLPKNLKDHE